MTMLQIVRIDRKQFVEKLQNKLSVVINNVHITNITASASTINSSKLRNIWNKISACKKTLKFYIYIVEVWKILVAFFQWYSFNAKNSWLEALDAT